jgi:hypothetical protein
MAVALVQFTTALWKPFEMEFGSFEADLRRLHREVTEAIQLASTRSTVEYQKNGMRFRDMVKEWRDKDNSQQVSLAKQRSSQWSTQLEMGTLY